MFRFKINTLITHITGWLLFLVLPLLFLNSGNKTGSAWVLLSSPFYWLFCVTYLFLFYFNTLFLIPSFFLKKKYWLYSILVLGMAGLVFFLQPFDKLLANNPRFQAQIAAAIKDSSTVKNNGAVTGQQMVKSMGIDTNKRMFGPLPNESMHMQDPVIKKPSANLLWQHSRNIDIVSLVLFFMIVGLGISVTTIEQWHTTEQKVVKAEAEKVNAELSFLKAQINPHFFFNTLNTIYSYTLSDGDIARTAITNLSKMMRYVLYDAEGRQTSLSKEIAFIKEYTELMKLRITSKTTVLLQIQEQVTEVMIAPMLFLPFVENAFKHGVSSIKEGDIIIWILQTEDSVELRVRNTVYERPRTSEDESNGIGLLNTKRRLDLLYPGKYTLSTGMINETEYEAKLRLML